MKIAKTRFFLGEAFLGNLGKPRFLWGFVRNKMFFFAKSLLKPVFASGKHFWIFCENPACFGVSFEKNICFCGNFRFFCAATVRSRANLRTVSRVLEEKKKKRVLFCQQIFFCFGVCFVFCVLFFVVYVFFRVFLFLHFLVF